MKIEFVIKIRITTEAQKKPIIEKRYEKITHC